MSEGAGGFGRGADIISPASSPQCGMEMTMTMTMTFPAQLQIASDRRAEAALDGALLRQTGLLATIISERRDAAIAPGLNHAELMRLVKSQQALLKAAPRRPSLQPQVKDATETFAPLRWAA